MGIARGIARSIARRITAGGGGGVAPSLLLDEYTGALAAYDLTKLRTGYSGAAIRVRESSGNTEADIGFNVDGTLDTTALLAHCGSNSGYVTTWYDQQGSENYVQTTALSQPRIVSSGVVETLNGKPAIRALGSEFLQNTPSITGTTLSVLAVASVTQFASGFARLVTFSAGSGDAGQVQSAAALLRANGVDGILAYRNGGELSLKTLTVNSQYIFCSKFDGTNHTAYTNGTAGTPVVSAGSFASNESAIFSDYAAAANKWNGYLQSLIITDDSISDVDRSLVEQKLNTFYGVY